MSSSIPAAITNLQTLLVAAFPASTTQVWFGKTLSTYIAPLTIQWTGVTGDQQPGELGPNYRREETYAIEMEIVSFAGDQDYVARTNEAMTAFNIVSVTVANNYTLNNAVRFAEVGTFDLVPEAGDQGQSMARISFAIHCSQRINSLT
jgi:hypothetical protein